MVDVLPRWDTRRDWSGEVNIGGAVLLQRFNAVTGSGSTRTIADSANPAHTWTVRNYANTAGLSAGRWGNNLSLNRTAPATEQTSLTVPYFAGLWPASGKMLFRAWASLSFAMSFTPIISSRNTAGVAPLAYLSTTSDGRPRAMLYNAAGTPLLDQSESIASIGWTPAANEWVCYLWLVDLDAKTSQVALVRRDTGQTFVGPVRTFTGTPNAACVADFEVATLSPTAAYWAGGYIDEVGYWRPAGAVSMADLVADAKHALPARGADSTSTLTVTDGEVTATVSGTLLTAARAASWELQPDIVTTPPTAATPAALTSTDDGATWATPAELPEPFTGLVRWSLPMSAGETLTAIELVERPVAPTVNADTLTAAQTEEVDGLLTGTWEGVPDFDAIAPAGIGVTITETTMTVDAGWAVGDWPIVVTVTDDTGLSGTATWTLTVTPPEDTDAPNPVYAEAPLIIYDATDQRALVVADPIAATLITEVNGTQTLTFTLPEAHRARPAVIVERIVEVAGELYRVRRIMSYRDRNVPMVEVYCEARFYDLGTSGQIDAASYAGVQAGTVMADILTDSGWTIGRVNVTTSRSWQLEAGTPLAGLRQVAKVHGGDLAFDNAARTVSLLTFSGRRRGLTFFYGRGVTNARRVEDTTTLATRIYARNADGLTIADVNGGLPYVEDTTWTDEVKTAVYDFAAGTNPYTMLAMASAALGKRAKPSVSYEVDVVDLSAWSGEELDRFACGDEVKVIDAELGIDTTDRIIRLEYDLLRPWLSRITLADKLRELGDTSASDAGVLTTGTDIDTRDMVPFNLLLNARFDNGLAHWAASGATVQPDGVTGPNCVEFTGGGTRWIEQTVAPDTRDVYTLSFQMDAEGWPEGIAPELIVVAEVTYDDDTTETLEQRVA